MSRLEFAVDADIDVPVEVYDHRLSLVARTLSSGSVKLEPGTYAVIARLPAGDRMRTLVEVGGRKTLAVIRGAQGRRDRQRRSRSVPERARRSLAHSALSRRSLSRGVFRDSEQIPVSFPASETYWSLDDWLTERPDRRSKPAGGAWLTYEIDWTHGQMQSAPRGVVALHQKGRASQFASVPGHGIEYFQIGARLQRDGSAALDVELADKSAGALLGYLHGGLFEDARLLSDSIELDAESLLFHKHQDPVAAAAGAFALLRLGALERLHDWTSNLARQYGWLSDVHVALAEHHARVGDHETAREILAEMSTTGIPSLTVGLAYATDRLRFYAAYWPEDGRLQRALRQLAPYAAAATVTSAVTTFSGPRSGYSDY